MIYITDKLRGLSGTAQSVTYVRITIDTHLTLERIVVHGNGHACTESRHGDLIMRCLHLARLLPEGLHLQHRHCVTVKGDELQTIGDCVG